MSTITDIREIDSKRLVEDLWESDNKELIYIQTKNPAEDFRFFCENFKIIYAAGGLVKNDLNELLFIYRLDKWDLPKGKVEEGETIPFAAQREVEEECGIGELELLDKAVNTYHMYPLKGEFVLKETHWYHMKTTDTTTLVPQEEENISEAKWVNVNDMKQQFRNTYASIRELLNQEGY